MHLTGWSVEMTSCARVLLSGKVRNIFSLHSCRSSVVAHDCGYPLSRYTCRATRVAADFLDFRALCRCSTGVALHPLKILVSASPPSPGPGGVAPKFGSEKVSRYKGGVAAAVAGVALHCATKRSSLVNFLYFRREFQEQRQGGFWKVVFAKCMPLLAVAL